MTSSNDKVEIAEIEFEVGHSSIIRSEPLNTHNPPRTHDWKVFLRSAVCGGDLNSLIKRCVFHLHSDFENNKREFKSTPFAVTESGYAGFTMPIEIYFNTKKEPKKYRIDYDLDLHTNIEGQPFKQRDSKLKRYRCTFTNPDPDLRDKILAAGGKIKHVSSSKKSNSPNEQIDHEVAATSPPELISRASPQQKRPISPIVTINLPNNKKVKVEQTSTSQKKKTPTTVKNENTTIKISSIKKSQITTVPDEKPIKTTSTEDSTSIKSRPSSKLTNEQDVKPSIQLLNNIATKKKEPISSPTKSTTQNTMKKPVQTAQTKSNTSKITVKTEPTITINKSPSNINIKPEPSPPIPSSNSTASTGLISSLKKIPKKVVPPPPPPPPPVVDKRSRSSVSSSKTSDRDFHRHSSSKTQSNSKHDRSSTTTPPSSSSINSSSNSRSSSNSNRSSKHSSHRDRSRSRSRSRSHSRNHSNHNNRSHHSSRHSSSQQKDRSNRHTSPHSHSTSKSSSSHNNNNNHRRTPTPPKSSRSPKRSNQNHNEHNSTTNDITISSVKTPQSRPDSVEPIISSSANASPSIHPFHSEDDHTQTPMDIDGQSDDDTRTHRQSIKIHSQDDLSTKVLRHSNVLSDDSSSISDTNESHDNNLSTDDDDDDDDDNDLLSVLTDDDLRSKLIYIYNRFTSNINIFVRFFKRHHLIDITNKSTSDTITYDLFSLTPPLIDELAIDLGYNNSILNQTEQ